MYRSKILNSRDVQPFRKIGRWGIIAMKKFTSILILSFCLARTSAQKVDPVYFESLLKSNTPLYFDSAKGSYFGCGWNLDCMNFPIVFKTILIDTANKKLFLEVYIYPTLDGNDTIGTNVFRVFTGKPGNNTIMEVNIIADVFNEIRVRSNETFIDLKTARVRTSFQFSKGDHLYFECGSMYGLKEYDISNLLK